MFNREHYVCAVNTKLQSAVVSLTERQKTGETGSLVLSDVQTQGYQYLYSLLINLIYLVCLTEAKKGVKTTIKSLVLATSP